VLYYTDVGMTESAKAGKKQAESGAAYYLRAALEWIDAIPKDIADSLQAMPGFNRDEAETAVSCAKTSVSPIVGRAIEAAFEDHFKVPARQRRQILGETHYANPSINEKWIGWKASWNRCDAAVRIADLEAALMHYANGPGSAVAIAALAAQSAYTTSKSALQRYTMDSKGLPFFDDEGVWVLFQDVAEQSASPVAVSDGVNAAVKELFMQWPNDEMGPSDEPDSVHRMGYNAAIEDVLEILGRTTVQQRVSPVAVGDAAKGE
jgi:hypothetical protein